jgi:hypothetical protein
VVPGTGLDDLMAKGEFQPLDDEGILREIQLFIENLDVQGTLLASDHILNLLEELEGKLPEDKPRILSIIQRYFALPEQERLIYRLGRRSGSFRKLDDLANADIYCRIKAVVDRYATDGGDLEKDMIRIMNNYI